MILGSFFSVSLRTYSLKSFFFFQTVKQAVNGVISRLIMKDRFGEMGDFIEYRYLYGFVATNSNEVKFLNAILIN